MGIENFWKKVADDMGAGWTATSVQDELTKIASRRNQIVHEADLERKISTKRFPLRDIEFKFADESVGFLKEFVAASDKVVEDEKP
jgi:hypothetical protein